MATRKPRKFGDGGGVREGQNTNIDDDTRARAMKWVQQQQEGKSDSDDTPAPKPAPKAAPKPKATPKADAPNYGNEGRREKSKADTPNYSNEGRGKEMSKKQQIEREVDSIKPTAEQTQKGLEIVSSMMGGAGLKALHNAAKKLAGTGAKRAAESGGSRAVSTAVDDGVTFLGKSGRRQVGGFDEIARTPKAIADGSRKAVGSESRTAIADNATKRITGPSKRDIVERDRAARASKRQSEMGETNASRHGLDPKSADYADKAKATRDNLGGSDWSLGMKRGGKVKPKMAFKAGGSVSSRADGIASRGKTRGKMC